MSEIVAFNDRIWFVNGEPFRNFNAADIYSFDPSTGKARYEHGLFSQGAGMPAVIDGRLFWPYEDPRSNAGLGEYEVTDGNEWQRTAFTDGNALHVHTIQQCGGQMLAGTGGWIGALQRSVDGGKTWREVYRLPEVQGQLSRITNVSEFNGTCVFGVTAWEQPGQRLFEFTDAGARPIEAWPAGERTMSLTSFKGGLYALHDGTGGRQTLHYDGKTVTPVVLPTSGSAVDIAASDTLIAIVTSDPAGGDVYVSQDGFEWTLLQRIVGESPIDVFVIDDLVYVGTHTANGGSLWGPSGTSRNIPSARALDKKEAQPVAEDTLESALRTLNTALAPKPDYTSYQSGILNIVVPLAMTHNEGVGLHLSKRARRDLPPGNVMTFTKQSYTYEALARWFLLYGAGLTCKGRVELGWLSESWTTPARDSEKYFDTSLAAIWAAGFMNQSNVDTIDILVERLGRSSEPNWLKGDVIAALTKLTGQRFGHDIPAWQAWWPQARSDWTPPQSQ